MNNLKTIRQLIDECLSLQFCRENVVIPLSVEPALPPNKQIVKIAVANFTYLGTIGEFLKQKFIEKGYECTFVEKSPDDIQLLLNGAAEERRFNSEGVQDFDFSEEVILETLNGNETSSDSIAINQ